VSTDAAAATAPGEDVTTTPETGSAGPQVGAGPAAPPAPTSQQQPSSPEAAQPAPQTEPSAKGHRRWSRGRIALLVTGAAVLGVLGGGGLGYAIQAQRPPTPLPPLAGDKLSYPVAHATASPAPLPADQDDAVRTDGDLTALLMHAPSGSRPWEQPNTPDGWLSPAAFAQGYDRSGSQFRWLLTNGFRRAAEADWMQGDTSYQLVLLQFQKQSEDNISRALTDQEGYAQSATGGSAVAVPGTQSGDAYAGTKARTDQNGNTYYQARGFARHGDIIVEVYVDGSSQISSQSVMSVLQSQLERL
jgi:hypothetical protein